MHVLHRWLLLAGYLEVRKAMKVTTPARELGRQYTDYYCKKLDIIPLDDALGSAS